MKEIEKCPFSAGITVRFRCGTTVRFPRESPSAFPACRCPFSARIRVRFAQELLSVFGKKVCPFSVGMGVRFGQEYARYPHFSYLRSFLALYLIQSTHQKLSKKVKLY